MAWLHSPSSVTGISLCFKIIQSSSTEFMETKILAPTVSPSVEHLNYDTRSFLICLGSGLQSRKAPFGDQGCRHWGLKRGKPEATATSQIVWYETAALSPGLPSLNWVTLLTSSATLLTPSWSLQKVFHCFLSFLAQAESGRKALDTIPFTYKTWTAYKICQYFHLWYHSLFLGSFTK